MIHVPDDIAAELRKPNVKSSLRVKWTLNDSSVFDISNRVSTNKMGTIKYTIRSLLGGYKSGSFSLLADNDDGFFSPSGTNSVFNNRVPEDFIDSVMTIEQGVIGPTTGEHFIPVYRGLVDSMEDGKNGVQFRLTDFLTRLLSVESPEEFVIMPTTSAPLQMMTYFLNFTPVELSDIDLADTFTFVMGVLGDIGWPCMGRIERNTPASRAMDDLAHSCMCQIYPTESGIIRLATELPRVCGSRTRSVDIFPGIFDESNAGGFETYRGQGSTACEVAVEYQGVSTSYLNSARLAKLKYRRRRRVAAPFLIFARQAQWLARLLFESVDGIVETTKLYPQSLSGLQMQLDDRVRVRNPRTDEVSTYRVMSKKWHHKGCSFEVQREPHFDSIIDKSDFFQWGSTTWGDSTEVML